MTDNKYFEHQPMLKAVTVSRSVPEDARHTSWRPLPSSLYAIMKRMHFNTNQHLSLGWWNDELNTCKIVGFKWNFQIYCSTSMGWGRDRKISYSGKKLKGQKLFALHVFSELQLLTMNMVNTIGILGQIYISCIISSIMPYNMDSRMSIKLDDGLIISGAT